MAAADPNPAVAADDDARPGKKRVYVNQSDVPRFTLDQALAVPEAISRQYAKQPTKPLDLAIALDQKPNSGQFRTLCGAAQAYGLTDGGPRVQAIALTGLGRRAVAPTLDGDDLVARRQAVLQPRVVREFLTRYDDHPLPKPNIAYNVLEELGVPPEVAQRTFDFIVDSARSVGMLRDLKGDVYVDLDPRDQPTGPEAPAEVLKPESESDQLVRELRTGRVRRARERRQAGARQSDGRHALLRGSRDPRGLGDARAGRFGQRAPDAQPQCPH